VHVCGCAQVASGLFQVVAGLALRRAQRSGEQVRAERTLARARRVAPGLVAQRQRGLRRVVHDLYCRTSDPTLRAAHARNDQVCASADGLPYTETQQSIPPAKRALMAYCTHAAAGGAHRQNALHCANPLQPQVLALQLLRLGHWHKDALVRRHRPL
jgi:hypothetical protein